MASDETIRAALRAAAKGICCHGHQCEHERGIMDGPCGGPVATRRAAVTVAAFLRAPGIWMALAEDGTEAVAAALARAAEGEG